MLLHQRHHSFPVSFVFHPSPSKIGSFNVLQTRSLLKLSEYWTCEHFISENRINIGLVNIFQIIQTLWKLDWWVSVKEPRHQICLNSKQWTRNFQVGKTKLIFVSLLLKDIKSMNIAMENFGHVNIFFGKSKLFEGWIDELQWKNRVKWFASILGDEPELLSGICESCAKKYADSAKIYIV